MTVEELYDLDTDPGETENLLPDYRGDFGRLRAAVRDYLDVVRRSRASEGADAIVLDDAIREKLRALGYIE